MSQQLLIMLSVDGPCPTEIITKETMERQGGHLIADEHWADFLADRTDAIIRAFRMNTVFEFQDYLECEREPVA